LPVHYGNIKDVLPSNFRLSAAGGTPIEVLGHCKIPVQLKNSFSIETDFIISPSIKEPMLGIEWWTKNSARWNFLDGTIIIQNPIVSVGDPNSSKTKLGREMFLRGIHTQESDCTGVATGHVVLPTSTSPISKEVLFHAVDKICNAARPNSVIIHMLDNFIRNLIKGVYLSQNNGNPLS